MTLRWTNPNANTDGTLIRHVVRAEICRSDAENAPCLPQATVDSHPGAPQEWTGALAAADTTGAASGATYRIRLVNRNGADAGESNRALVALGSAPADLTSFKGEYTPEGVRLTWTETSPAAPAYRIRRYLASAGPNAQPEQVLELRVRGTEAIDATAKRDTEYRYTVQPVARERIVTSSGVHYLEMAANPTQPVSVNTPDVFPPSAPQGLAAIAGVEHGSAYIDLSWEPNGEADVAGYLVFRQANGGAGEQITPQPGVPATLRDSAVTPGVQYTYSVVAVDQSGNRSKPSAKVTETASQP